MDFKALQKSTDLYLILGENHITEKQKLEPANHYKPATVQCKTSKTRDLDEFRRRWSADTMFRQVRFR